MKSSALLCVFVTIAFIVGDTHGLVGNVCTRRAACYRNKRVCRYHWWGKTVKVGYLCDQQYCCPGWTDTGSGNCTMRVGSNV